MDLEILKIIALLKTVSLLNESHLEKSVNLLKSLSLLRKSHLEELMGLLKLLSLKIEIDNYQANKNIEPFNIILAASGKYYYENYNSDIIVYILNKKQNTIGFFIKFVNSLPNPHNPPDININNFPDAEVTREENKIDILIKNESSRHCIIIENKLNNAGDMPRQLPRYYDSLVEKNYTVDRIIYFSLDGKKLLDKSTWTDEDKLELDKILVYGAAADGTEKDFINEFLMPCKNNAEDEQERSFYNQYIDLLKYLRRDFMNYQLMEEFYKEMLNVEQYKSALSVKSMLDDLNEFRREHIYNHFANNHEPFEKTERWENYCTYYENIKEISSKDIIEIAVCCEENLSKIRFMITKRKTKSDLIGTILTKIDEKKNFKKENINSYFKIFKFPEEDDKLYEYLSKLFSLLDKHKNSIN
jgi:hypothetical protein